jgi:hypothetical protein
MNTVKDIGQQILSQVQAKLGTAWEDSLLQADRDLIAEIAQDAAQLQIDALSTPALGTLATSDAQVALLRDKAQINAQLANVASITAAEVSSAFWGAVTNVATAAVKIAVAAVV